MAQSRRIKHKPQTSAPRKSKKPVAKTNVKRLIKRFQTAIEQPKRIPKLKKYNIKQVKLSKKHPTAPKTKIPPPPTHTPPPPPPTHTPPPPPPTHTPPPPPPTHTPPPPPPTYTPPPPSVKQTKTSKTKHMQFTKSGRKALVRVSDTIAESSVLLSLLVDMQQQMYAHKDSSPTSKRLFEKCVAIKNKISQASNTCHDKVINICKDAITGKGITKNLIKNLSQNINTFFTQHTQHIQEIATLRQETLQLSSTQPDTIHLTANDKKFNEIRQTHLTTKLPTVQSLLRSSSTTTKKLLIAIFTCLSTLFPLCIISVASLASNLIMDKRYATKNKKVLTTATTINDWNNELNSMTDLHSALGIQLSNDNNELPSQINKTAHNLSVLSDTLNKSKALTKNTKDKEQEKVRTLLNNTKHIADTIQSLPLLKHTPPPPTHTPPPPPPTHTPPPPPPTHTPPPPPPTHTPPPPPPTHTPPPPPPTHTPPPPPPTHTPPSPPPTHTPPPPPPTHTPPPPPPTHTPPPPPPTHTPPPPPPTHTPPPPPPTYTPPPPPIE